MKLAGLTAAGVGSVAGLEGTATAEENKQNTRCDGLVTVEGGETVEETVERIEVAIEEAEPELIMTFDHAANAESVGEDLRETILILLGAPTVGTPIMQENQTAEIDLPQKLLIWCNEESQVQITYNDPKWSFADRHGVSAPEQTTQRSLFSERVIALGARQLSRWLRRYQ